MTKLRQTSLLWQVCEQMSRSVCDRQSEAEDWESHVESLCVKIEYYRSFEYSQNSMSTRCSSRRHNSKESHDRASSPDEGAVQCKRRKRKRQSRTEAGNSVCDRNEQNELDLIDIFCDTHDETCPDEEDEGKSAAMAGKWVDDSDTSSIASGPSSFYPPNNKRWRAPRDFCSACQNLYQRSERMKTPILDKLLDNDPNSLTCDQWVLNKEWRPRRLPNARGNLLTHVKLVKTRLRTGVKQNGRESSACLRPHTFLQRNLRRCVPRKKREEEEKKKKKNGWKKRSGGYPQGSAAAKKRRLHSNRQRPRGRPARDTIDTDSNSSLSFERSCNQNVREKRQRTAEVSPSSLPLETTMEQGVASEEKTTKKKNGFLGLLAQLRGNSSIIVRETQ